MALKVRDMVKNFSGDGTLELRADVGESLHIKKIYIYSPIAKWVTLKIDKTTVGYFRISWLFGNHLFFPKHQGFDGSVVQYYPRNLLDFLYEREIFTGYPIGEGETFVVKPDNVTGWICTIVYDVYDAGDMKPTDPNGSKSTEYFLMNYGDAGGAIDASGDFLYTNPLNPVEFPAFPFGVDVPAKTEIVLHGICGSDVGVLNATPVLAICTKYLKLVKEREVLLDEDRNGLMFDGSQISLTSEGVKYGCGLSVIGGCSNADARFPFMFSEPLVFGAGEELNIYVTVVELVDGKTIDQDYQAIGLIETVRKVG